MGAVEEYLSAFQTGLSQPGDVLNVPVTLLDDAWVASHRICADATLVGTVVGMSPPGAVSWVHVDVECYFEVLDIPSDDPCLRRFVRPPALNHAAQLCVPILSRLRRLQRVAQRPYRRP